GQVEDLAWERSTEGPAGTVEALENIHARKTGALFRVCLRLGAWVAQGEQPGGPDPELLDRLDAYGRCFGLAFQITDDLLDIEGDSAQTGKRVHKDASRGKLTYPGFWGVDESRRRARRLCEEAHRQVDSVGPAAERLQALLTFVLERNR